MLKAQPAEWTAFEHSRRRTAQLLDTFRREKDRARASRLARILGRAADLERRARDRLLAVDATRWSAIY